MSVHGGQRQTAAAAVAAGSQADAAVAVRGEPPSQGIAVSSAFALRISYVAFAAGAFAALVWIGSQVVKVPLPPRLQLPIEVVGMTWPLSLYAVAMYRRKLGAK